MKLIYLEWQDAIHNANWFEKDLAEEWHNATQFLIKECGWLVKEDKKGITLACRYKVEDNHTVEQFGGLQYIPKTWVKKRKEIKI
jgi:hypothetical protein